MEMEFDTSKMIDYSKVVFVEKEKKKKRVQINVAIYNEEEINYAMWRKLCKKKSWNQSQLIRNCIMRYMHEILNENK